MVRAMQLFLGMAVLAFACAAEAQQPVVYPAQGQQQQQIQTYDRAYGACMEGRGSTIK